MRVLVSSAVLSPTLQLHLTFSLTNAQVDGVCARVTVNGWDAG